MTEQELIFRLQNGDELAFKELVTQLQDKVYNTALGFLQNTTDAEDIAQDVFIQVYHSVNNFKQQSLLSTWIYRITVTKCLDQLRKQKTKKRFGFIISLFDNRNTLLHEPQDFNHPGVQLDKKEDAKILFELLNKLPESQRTVFILNKIEGLSYYEIAQIQKTTEAAIDSLLQRAKQNLRKKIKNRI
ncbi:MAG: RNA polymerase sigma factor [Ferruginibacter sp.]|nr:RNA polymerase sigma factor [Ferruginibacter sp.]